MDKTFNYESVPSYYVHCLNRQCVRSEKCMRHLVAAHSNSSRHTFSVVNPACIPEDTSTCSYFHPIRMVHMAWGVKSLLDKVPSKKARVLKTQLIEYFGRTHYYCLYRKENGITPEQQQFIRHLFRSQEILEEPDFDGYSDEYQWK